MSDPRPLPYRRPSNELDEGICDERVHDLAALARFVLEVDDSPPAEICSAIATALPDEIRSSVMTAADQLRAEGALEARREILLEQLEIKFGPVDREVRTRIEHAPLEQLIAWMRRFAVASMLEEVFAS